MLIMSFKQQLTFWILKYHKGLSLFGIMWLHGTYTPKQLFWYTPMDGGGGGGGGIWILKYHKGLSLFGIMWLHGTYTPKQLFWYTPMDGGGGRGGGGGGGTAKTCETHFRKNRPEWQTCLNTETRVGFDCESQFIVDTDSCQKIQLPNKFMHILY